MVHRQEEEYTLLITQTAHAAISAQFAQHWGNDQFGDVTPRAEVQLGTTLHDISWIDWENDPKLNPETGLPYSFIELQRGDHLKIWSAASRLARPFGRYPSLLVSMHGTRLYSMIDYAQEYPEHIDDINAYLTAEKQFQTDTIRSLQKEPLYAESATLENIGRNSDLVAIWDWLSLLICHKIDKQRTIKNVPTATTPTTLTLTPLSIYTDQSEIIQLDPWPFHITELTITLEGKRFATPQTDQNGLQQVLAQAPWHTIPIQLVPAQ